MENEHDYISFVRTCRTCLNTSGEMHPLFEKLDIFHQMDVGTVLAQFSINIDHNPDFSDVICGKCFSTVMEFYNFYERSQNSQELLLQKKYESESEFKSETVEIKCEDPLFVENQADVKTETDNDNNVIRVEFRENIKKFFNHVCPLCWKPFRALASFIRHMKIHPDTKIRCRNCHKLCMNVDSFLAHYKKEFEVRKSWIKKEKKEKRLARKVETTAEEELKMECKQCEKKFEEYPEYTKHLEVHKVEDDGPNQMEKKLICPVCLGKPMTTFRSFERHVSKHTHFKCNYCDETFQQGLDFIEHFKVIHRHQCNVCGEFFSRNIFLQRHLTTHDQTYDPTLQCSEADCGRKFYTTTALAKHKAVHTPDKKDAIEYLCNICGAKQTNYDSMRYHKMKHEGPKYLCSYCGRAFMQKVHLNYHMWRHTGVKPFGCNDCAKSFVTKKLLNIHIKKGCRFKSAWKMSEVPKKEEGGD